MKSLQQFIESGIIEMYVLNNTTADETKQVELMAAAHPEVRREIEEISNALGKLAMKQSAVPAATVKPFLMATINYMERMQGGEAQSFPPALTSASKIADYSEWLERKDLNNPPETENLYARIISHTPELITAIVWIKEMAPHEVHDNEYEKFLIVEGTCNILIEDEVHSLFPGDFLQIPLHKGHRVQVTSPSPCKVILQRMAA